MLESEPKSWTRDETRPIVLPLDISCMPRPLCAIVYDRTLAPFHTCIDQVLPSIRQVVGQQVYCLVPCHSAHCDNSAGIANGTLSSSQSDIPSIGLAGRDERTSEQSTGSCTHSAILQYEYSYSETLRSESMGQVLSLARSCHCR
jgi:hypothetical protein